MKRQHRATSKAAHEYIKPKKQPLHEIIKLGLEKLRVGGNYEEISTACGLRPDQVWRRLSEMQGAGTIYPTGITRKLSSGLQGTVWQLVESTDKNKPKIFTQLKAF